MVQQLFSSTLSSYTGKIENSHLIESLESLRRFLGARKLSILEWDEQRIAIPLKLSIDLPPLGNYEGLDIRENENIILVLDIKKYPSTAPSVFTDRLDFPKDKLAHLYIAKNGRPPGFCLVRGNINEWYAEKNLKDLVIRARNWLRDAAIGELTENGNQFDPLRLEGYRGTIIYQYNELADVVHNDKSFYEGSNFSLALFEKTSKEEDFPSFKIIKLISLENSNESIKEYLASIKTLIENKTFNVKQYHFGYIIWSRDATTFKQYCIDLPRSWSALASFFEEFKIDKTDLEAYLAEQDFNFFPEIPLIVAVKRPKPVIGFSSDLEFINFYVELTNEDKADKKIITDIPVHFQSHNEPLSTGKAKEVSGSNLNLSGTIVVGCGALGSKLVMHFARNGTTDFLLLDPDKISPHNLVRHALLAESEGMNKAVALWKAIKNMYRYEKLEIVGLPFSGDFIFSDLVKEGLHTTKAIFDFTASETFLNTLVNSQIPHIQICRAIISDHGNLGLMFIEGKDRNPRIDDLQILLYDKFKLEPCIKEWLQRELIASGSEKALITVGVGCNSETVILPDEIISSHAAYFAGAIKHDSPLLSNPKEGQIFLSQISNQSEYKHSTKKLLIEPVVVCQPINDSSWEIRIKAGLLDVIRSEMGLAMPHETGGVFIGACNFKTKTIHITEVITAPSDSTSNPICFCRGIHGLPDAVQEFNSGTGNQLGYIGEWHTHPFGPNALSRTDMKSVKRFKQEFETLSSPLPVLLIISTPTGIYPYVY